MKIEDMRELQEIYYGPKRDGRNVSVDKIRRYEDWLRTHIMSPKVENVIEKFFSKIGKVERIQRGGNEKINDFKIVSKKLLIEVTSINTVMKGEQDVSGRIPINLPKNEEEFIKKIDKAIDHIEEKEDKEYNDYLRIGVISYDAILSGLSHELIRKLEDTNFIKKTKILSSSLAGLLFWPPKVGGNLKIPIPVFHIKNRKVVDLIEKKYGSKEVKIVRWGI